LSLLSTSGLGLLLLLLLLLLLAGCPHPPRSPARQHRSLPPAVQLPRSTSRLVHLPRVRVVVTLRSVRVDGDEVARVEGGRIAARFKRDGAEGYLVEGLLAALRRAARRSRSTPHTLTLFADQRVPYRVIMEVLYTAGQAEYGELMLAVSPYREGHVRVVHVTAPRFDSRPSPPMSASVTIASGGWRLATQRGRGALALLAPGASTLHRGLGELARALAETARGQVGRRRLLVTAAPEVSFGELIRTLDACRKTFPEVVLSAGTE
jgi:biopolymer transport protein ExbD